MAGGTWTSQNKIRPGVYIRFNPPGETTLSVGTRGIVAICEPMSWGPVAQVMTVAAGADTTPFCGYAIGQPEALFLNQIFLGTDRTDGPTTVLLYRPTASGSAQATVTTGVLTATALYPGVRGNDISISITQEVDAETFTVTTTVDGTVVDEQTGITNVSDLVANSWVTFSGTGAVAAATGKALTGGADGTVETAAYTAFLSVIEPYKFDILIYDGTDATTLTAMAAFVERLADENGQYCQLVAANMTTPDSRYVINVNSTATLADGTELTEQQVCWWVGGAEAGARFNQALTYAGYPGAVSTDMLTNAQYDAALKGGQLVLAADNGRVYIEQDINSLTTLDNLPEAYIYNRTIRLCNTIANDIYQQFSDNFIGVVNNDAAGRSQFQALIVGYLLDIQGDQGIQNFSASDVEVLPGESLNAIVVNVAIQPMGTVEKIYMTVVVS